MTGTRRPPVVTGGDAPMDEALLVLEASPPTQDVEAARQLLRQRWELASVLNFLNVFEPVIGDDLKIRVSAEDIETALIQQNSTLAELHIALLKGILPSDKALKDPDAWMIAVSKTLSTWWPWVGQGDLPLTVSKGEEISAYKQLDPASRLLILKALCEIRADQYDAVSYINDSLKDGTAVSNFRKEKLAGVENGISYWYDGNESIGYRLYKELIFYVKDRVKGKATLPVIDCHWETLATNLEEFKRIENEFSSSKNEVEVALSKSIAADVITVLEKQLKKKLKALQRQQRQHMLLNGLRNSGITRSCRNNKRVDYKFDDYDRSIKEAIQYANKRKRNEEQTLAENQIKGRKKMGATENSSNNSETSSRDGESSENDAGRSCSLGRDDSDESSHEKYDEEKENCDNEDAHGDKFEVNSRKQHMVQANRPKGTRFSKRLAGVPGHTVPESLNLGAKNMLRQRPHVNTAMVLEVVPDSEDECLHGDSS